MEKWEKDTDEKEFRAQKMDLKFRCETVKRIIYKELKKEKKADRRIMGLMKMRRYGLISNQRMMEMMEEFNSI